MIIAYLPIFGFLPTWWITVFGEGGGKAVEAGQWWIFVIANIAAYNLLEKGNWRMKLLYALWMILMTILQIAVWIR
ncbi:hypothetical protein H6761_00930 [Candidatus Nomurabacteria bacterium]|nr:hypothetical protein [Candidatus Nomurabacteria bacterium]